MVFNQLYSIVQVNLCQKLFYLQNMGRTCCVQKLFWMSETISVHNMFSTGLSLEFSRIELVINVNSMNNLLTYCGLVDAKIRATDKDLPVLYWSWFSKLPTLFTHFNDHMFSFLTLQITFEIYSRYVSFNFSSYYFLMLCLISSQLSKAM